MGVAADDEILGHPVEDRVEPLRRRDRRDDLLVAARRAVAEEDFAQTVDLHGERVREAAEKGELLVVQLLVHPASAPGPELLPFAGGRDLAVAVAADEDRAAATQQGERLVGHRPESHVAADENRVRVDLGEHGFQSREVRVDVVEGGDSHERVKRETDSTCGVCGNMSTGRTRSRV